MCIRDRDKRTDAIRMGATKYVNVNNPEEWKGLENSFRVILSTIPAKFNVEPVSYTHL